MRSVHCSVHYFLCRPGYNGVNPHVEDAWSYTRKRVFPGLLSRNQMSFPCSNCSVSHTLECRRKITWPAAPFNFFKMYRSQCTVNFDTRNLVHCRMARDRTCLSGKVAGFYNYKNKISSISAIGSASTKLLEKRVNTDIRYKCEKHQLIWFYAFLSTFGKVIHLLTNRVLMMHLPWNRRFPCTAHCC